MVVNHKTGRWLMREDNLLAVQPRAFVVTTCSLITTTSRST